MDKQLAMQLLARIDPEKDPLPMELMPKTKDASVSILGVLPMPYYRSLRPKTVNDVLDSPCCSISVMNKEFGEEHLRVFMVKILNEVIDYFSVGKSIGAVQVAQVADLIIEEYYFFKPDDFKLCFNRAKKGIYGKVFDRIDGQVLFEWLSAYRKERCGEAEQQSINLEHLRGSEHLHYLKKRSTILRSMILNVNTKLNNESDKYKATVG